MFAKVKDRCMLYVGTATHCRRAGRKSCRLCWGEVRREGIDVGMDYYLSRSQQLDTLHQQRMFFYLTVLVSAANAVVSIVKK